jgi:hypothetical protein
MYDRRMRAASIVVGNALALMLVACGEEPVPIPRECNGAVALCARRFDEVSYPTAHNAMSNAEDGWLEPNQNVGIARQLDAGVRALMLDIHEWGEDVLLCHGPCPLGSLPLVEGLARIRRFLRAHRGDVVTIIFESYVPAPRVAEAFAAADIDGLVHAHAPGTPWPTLRQLIDADERLVVLTDDDGGGAYDWYMDVWTHAFDNPYAAETIADFTCEGGRGDGANALFILNHFLSAPLAQPESAPTVNANPFLVDRARNCMAARAHLPNFVTVDFCDQGDLFDAVAQLNAR